jgi:hypothetical protein
MDGNVDNMNLNNIKLMCPNCHSITDNYKSKNRHKNTNRQLYGETMMKRNELIEQPAGQIKLGHEITLEEILEMKYDVHANFDPPV